LLGFFKFRLVFFGVGIGPVGLRLFVRDENMQLNRRLFARSASHLRSLRATAKFQSGFGIVLQTADILSHEPGEEWIHEIQNSFVAAKVFREMNRLPAGPV